jgi:rod shape-determining protein MreB
MSLFSSFNRKLGLDLGSDRIRVWIDEQKLVLDEPSLIAVDQEAQKVVAVGKQAQEMKGRVEGKVKVFAPIKFPQLEDDELVKALLKILLRKISQRVYFFSPTMLVSLPTHTFPVVKQTIVTTLSDLGASEVLVISQPLAAAIGAGVPIADASGSFILQMGASVVEAAAVSLGKIARVDVSQRAGSDMCQELVFWFKQQHQLKISDSIANQVKRNLGNFSNEAQYKLGVTGISLVDGSPTEVEVSATEIRQALSDYGPEYVGLVKHLLASISPDLTVDVIDKGLLLSGGLSQMPGLESYFVDQLSLPVSVVEDPDQAVIRGVGIALDHLDEFKHSLAYQQ